MTKDFIPMKVDASVIVAAIRQEYRENSGHEAIGLANECVHGLTDEQVINIATHKATLEGDSVSGVVYVEV